jgi:hypothetical protein
MQFFLMSSKAAAWRSLWFSRFLSSSKKISRAEADYSYSARCGFLELESKSVSLPGRQFAGLANSESGMGPT